MKSFQEYLEIAHLGKGFLSDKTYKSIEVYLKGDYVGGYIGHEGRFKQLDLLFEEIFLNGKGHINPKQLGEFLISKAGREFMDSVVDRLVGTAKAYILSRREEVITAAKKAAETEGDEDVR